MLKVPKKRLDAILEEICAKTNDAPGSLLALDVTANADHYRFPSTLTLKAPHAHSAIRVTGKRSPFAVRVRWSMLP